MNDTLSAFFQHSERASAIPVEGFLSLMLRILRQHLGMEVAFVSQFSAGRRYMRAVESLLHPAPIATGHSDPLDESYCQLVVDGRIPRLIHNAAQVPEVSHIAATHALPVGAHISVPLTLEDGSVYGTLCCFSTKPDSSLTLRDLSLMEAFSEIASERIREESRALNALNALRERVGSILEQQLHHSVYQPICNISLNKVIGFEALTRFDVEPRRSPDQWFADARVAGLDSALEIACVERALQCLPALPEDAYVSVNVSPQTFLTQKFQNVLHAASLRRIVLEITEHAVVESYSVLGEGIDALRRQGIRLAVDDAGAGYASFKHILALKPDIIKLDMSLVRDIDTDFHKQSLARGLMSFATAIGCKVVAEGVETERELAALRRIGVTKAQGYLLGRPLPQKQWQESGEMAGRG